MNVFAVPIPNEKEKVICQFQKDLKKSVCRRPNLCNNDIKVRNKMAV